MLWLRSLVFNLYFWLGTALWSVGLRVVLPFVSRQTLARFVSVYARFILAGLRWICGVRLRVTGAEHLPRSGPALVAAKHQSAYDTLVWLTLLPNACYILKQELLRIPLWGRVVSHTGHIGVDRNAGAGAMRHLLRAGRAAAADGQQMVIFPEGTRSALGERGSYQPGIVALATATGLPVIPVATDSGRCWARRAFLKHPGTITIAVLPPLPVGLPKAQLLTTLEEIIETESARLFKA
jgi:1-acyl-sn-glycerol-3-phosphate acyltransferase